MKKAIRETTYGGSQARKTITTRLSELIKLPTKVSRCVSETFSVTIPMWVMDMLEGYIIRECLSKTLPKYPREASRVFDLLDVEVSNRFLVMTSRLTSDSGILFSNCLGKQFQMGIDKLRVKLSQDTGREYTREEAAELDRMHKEIFSSYWRWVYDIRNQYQSGDTLSLPDGWHIGNDNPSITSVGNFPVQGLAAYILKVAVRKGLQEKLRIVYPLHDAITIYHRVEDVEAPEVLKRVMIEAFQQVLPGAPIRVDLETHTHDDWYCPQKGRKQLDMFKKYFDEELEAFQYDLLDSTEFCI